MSHRVEQVYYDTIYDRYLRMPRFELPEDAEYLKGCYWTAGQVARNWNVSRATAYRLMLKHGKELGLTRVLIVSRRRGEASYAVRSVIRAKSKKPSSRVGNPRLKDSAYQRENARRRWHDEKIPPTC